MRTVILNAADCASQEALHAFLARQLGFPTWYGNNLDALHDCLSEVRDETSIVIPNVAALEEQLGSYIRKLLRVLIDASSENPRVHLITE